MQTSIIDLNTFADLADKADSSDFQDIQNSMCTLARLWIGERELVAVTFGDGAVLVE